LSLKKNGVADAAVGTTLAATSATKSPRRICTFIARAP
jgi:hypothetical protein